LRADAPRPSTGTTVMRTVDGLMDEIEISTSSSAIRTWAVLSRRSAGVRSIPTLTPPNRDLAARRETDPGIRRMLAQIGRAQFFC
jgi:hypothetical protein